MMTQNPPLSCFGAGFFALGGDFTGDLTEDFFATPPLGAMAFSFGVVARAETRAETRAGDLAGVFLVGVFLGAALGVVAFFAGVTAFLEGVFAGVAAFFAGDFAGVAAFLAGVTAFLEGVLAGVAALAGDLGAAPLIPRNLSLRSLLLRAFSADLNSASARIVAQAPSRSREERKGNRRWGQISRGVGCGGTDGAASGAGRGGRRARRSSRGFDWPFATPRRVESRRSAGRRGNIDGGSNAPVPCFFTPAVSAAVSASVHAEDAFRGVALEAFLLLVLACGEGIRKM